VGKSRCFDHQGMADDGPPTKCLQLLNMQHSYQWHLYRGEQKASSAQFSWAPSWPPF